MAVKPRRLFADTTPLLALVDGPEPVIHDYVTAGREGSAQLNGDLFENGPSLT
ncbi:hypothetical protein BCL76_102429 [Streptomyces sp. CG 926]|nr:hypothetical protein BCL76_102429 [Streptomyces sp. CG 926]